MNRSDVTVLVVDDEPGIVNRYESQISADHEVRTATSGAAAIESLDREVDVILIDRGIPAASADDVLDAIEAGGLDVRVAIVADAAADSADSDIFDQRFDDYLVKPVTDTELRETVDRLLLIDEYSEHRRELNSLRVKRNVLEVEKPPEELRQHDEYCEVESRIAELETRVDALTDTLEGTPLTQYS